MVFHTKYKVDFYFCSSVPVGTNATFCDVLYNPYKVDFIIYTTVPVGTNVTFLVDVADVTKWKLLLSC